MSSHNLCNMNKTSLGLVYGLGLDYSFDIMQWVV